MLARLHGLCRQAAQWSTDAHLALKHPLLARSLAGQVVKFADAIPDNFRAYTYTLLSLGGGFALGIMLYGWSVWAY